MLDAGGLDAEEMQAIAADVGYSETAFVDGDAVRYFSPAIEVPFCGHATIATAVALAHRDGPGERALKTAAGASRSARRPTTAATITATLTSVPPHVEDAPTSTARWPRCAGPPTTSTPRSRRASPTPARAT